MPDQEDRTPTPTPSFEHPEQERDRVLRYTFADGFDEPKDLLHLASLGAVLLDYAREGDRWGGRLRPGRFIHGYLGAAAADLASMAEVLREVAEEPVDSGTSKEELALCHRCPGWAARVDAVVGEIMTAIQEQDGP